MFSEEHKLYSSLFLSSLAPLIKNMPFRLFRPQCILDIPTVLLYLPLVP